MVTLSYFQARYRNPGIAQKINNVHVFQAVG